MACGAEPGRDIAWLAGARPDKVGVEPRSSCFDPCAACDASLMARDRAPAPTGVGVRLSSGLSTRAGRTVTVVAPDAAVDADGKGGLTPLASAGVSCASGRLSVGSEMTPGLGALDVLGDVYERRGLVRTRCCWCASAGDAPVPADDGRRSCCCWPDWRRPLPPNLDCEEHERESLGGPPCEVGLPGPDAETEAEAGDVGRVIGLPRSVARSDECRGEQAELLYDEAVIVCVLLWRVNSFAKR
jgi:hypothetical protein